ncbi:MAG: hypothetical protein GQ544_05520, partial [Candidatus Aminicenantes bacterium]|nr:hypothetical protein [Candidatus Aminicenantes bacterium]
ECGFSLKEAAEVLGHSAIEMTARYVHSTGERKRQGMERLGEIVKKSRHKVDTMPKTTEVRIPARRSSYYN